MSGIKENGQQIVRELFCLLGHQDEIYLNDLNDLNERFKEKEEKNDIEKRY